MEGHVTSLWFSTTVRLMCPSFPSLLSTLPRLLKHSSIPDVATAVSAGVVSNRHPVATREVIQTETSLDVTND